MKLHSLVLPGPSLTPMPRKLQAPSKRAHLKARLDRLQASLILILPGVASKSEFSNRFKTWKVKFLEIWRRTATRYYMILLCSYRVSKQSSKMTCFWQEDDDDFVFDADELEGEEEAPNQCGENQRRNVIMTCISVLLQVSDFSEEGACSTPLVVTSFKSRCRQNRCAETPCCRSRG